MRVISTEELVMEHIKKGSNIIKECPEKLYRLNNLIGIIEGRGDERAVSELKYNCDLVDESLFSSIVDGLLPGVNINSNISLENTSAQKDEIILEELEKLIRHNTAISIGFYYDEKNRLRLNINRCITYLQTICDLIIMDGSLKVYNEPQGLWKEFTEELQGMIIRYVMNNTIKDSWKKSYEKDITEGLIREVARVENIVRDENLIALNNGVYDILKKQLLPHDKKYFFTNKSPIDFNENAKCPVFAKAISEILCNDDELISCFQEICGNTLINSTKAERAFFFTGVGSNGKSFSADIISAVVGLENISNIQLSKFSERFGTEGIVNKMLNIANENELGTAISTESLKAIISGDAINISRKFKQAIDYKSTVKLIFLLNTLPDTLDNTHGYYRKILIVPFEKVFRGDEVDKTLKQKVLQELKGVLCWFLEGAERLVSNGFVFTESEAIEKATKEYKEEQNPVESFYKEVLVFEEDHRIDKKTVLDAYKLWIDGQNISAKGSDSTQKFWKALNNASKINDNKSLVYKKNQGTMRLADYKIDYSKLPSKIDNYTFV